MTTRSKRIIAVVTMALIGFLVSGCLSMARHVTAAAGQYWFLAQDVPLPHHVPRYRGGLSFRFAMVHDVLHERFERHGNSFYEERNRMNARQLEEMPADNPARWPLMDDLAAGLDRISRPAEAVPLMRTKLSQQQDGGLSGRKLYTTYANLGTFLIHANARAAFAGDAGAIQRFAEGTDFVRQSVAVNPEAHFGREQWQAAIAEFLQQAMQNPVLLTEFDCIGNRLDLPVNRTDEQETFAWDSMYGRPNTPNLARSAPHDVVAFFENQIDHSDTSRWDELVAIRSYITTVGAEDGWDQLDIKSHQKRVAFDEPMLGIIGMWRQGGGANPHFALAIGETMLRVGQRYLAWSAYAQATQLADRYSTDPVIQQFLRDHCRQRQLDIERSLQEKPNGAYGRDPGSQTSSTDLTTEAGPTSPTVSSSALASTFEQELQQGKTFQEAYQSYETQQLQNGVSFSDPAFYDEFHTQHPTISSPVGSEEFFRYVPHSRMRSFINRRALAHAVFGAWCGAMLPTICFVSVQWLRRSRSKSA